MSKLDNVIATLNNLGVGSLDKIEAQLAAVSTELAAQELGDELVEMLDTCRAALLRGDVEEFRRIRETVVSRLGHLRVKSSQF